MHSEETNRHRRKLDFQRAHQEAADVSNVLLGAIGLDDERDWPAGDGDNDNYFNRCCVCHHQYRGHKRSVQCRQCAEKAEAEWKLLTPEQREEQMKELAIRIQDWVEANFSSPNVQG